MANYSYPNPQMFQAQYQQIQQMFPQPQGSVYSINSPLELGNVPIGSTGLSVVLCLNEDVMYIKSFQNGSPVIMAYRVAPYQKEQSPLSTSTPAANTTPNASTTIPNQFEERLTKLESLVAQLTAPAPTEEPPKKSGGKFDGII